MNDNDNRHWDARTYEKVSASVQLRWGQALLERRRWLGNEIILDAGAGSGSLTKILAEKVPRGQVYAVDADPNMVQQARANLSGYRNVQILHSSMDNASLPTQVDVVFSNAALHWVPDLEMALTHFYRILKSNGELLIECGGRGNLDRLISVIFDLIRSDQFREYFVGWKQTWYFPGQDEMEKLLKKIGFRDIEVSLSQRTTSLSDRQSFASFAKTVIMQPFLGYLPDEMKDHFLETFLSIVEYSSPGWSLDSVRLSIFARK